MKTSTLWFTTTVLGLLVLSAACTKAPREEAPTRQTANEQRQYEVRGIVRSIEGGGRSITIEHEDIPGFMPSMTMPFALKDPREIIHITPGMAVQFQLVVTDSDSWISGVRALETGAVHLPASAQTGNSASSAPRLKEGDRIPEMNLIDQENRPLTRVSLEGKATVLTFIFTRCPLPNFCPLMTRNFADLQHRIAADPALAGRVQLLSISFDPADSPELLSRYASAFTQDTDSWRFATGTPEETAKLTHAFSVYIEREGGTISHGLCTALIGPDGRAQKIWRGNDWSVDEVLQSVKSVNAGAGASAVRQAGANVQRPLPQ